MIMKIWALSRKWGVTKCVKNRWGRGWGLYNALKHSLKLFLSNNPTWVQDCPYSTKLHRKWYCHQCMSKISSLSQVSTRHKTSGWLARLTATSLRSMLVQYKIIEKLSQLFASPSRQLIHSSKVFPNLICIFWFIIMPKLHSDQT